MTVEYPPKVWQGVIDPNGEPVSPVRLTEEQRDEMLDWVIESINTETELDHETKMQGVRDFDIEKFMEEVGE